MFAFGVGEGVFSRGPEGNVVCTVLICTCLTLSRLIVLAHTGNAVNI